MKKNLERVKCWRCGAVRYKNKMRIYPQIPLSNFWECANQRYCKWRKWAYQPKNQSTKKFFKK